MSTSEINNKLSAIEEALKNCERERIHQVGRIQPMGVLFVLEGNGLIITQVSENIGEWFHYTPAILVGQPFAILVGEEEAQKLHSLIGLNDWRRTAITSFNILKKGRAAVLDAQVSYSEGKWLVEIEQEVAGQGDLFQKLFIPIRDSLWQLDAEADLSRYTQKVVEQVRLLTGYDRVMMYQFDSNWDGEVVAESKSDDAESYLGNRFPASDIPPQARELYTKNLVRLIADVDAVSIEIEPVINNHSNQPLDLTYSAFRALSPVHLQYLRNMGVCATLTISLIQNERLWGLIACHHFTPKYIPLRIRELDEFIGKTVSLKLSNLENAKQMQYHQKIRALLENLTSKIKQQRDIQSVIDEYRGDLLSLVRADGALINLRGKHIHVGETPTEDQQAKIEEWLRIQPEQNVFQTDSLPALNPELKTELGALCGLMVAPLDSKNESYIAWFRSGITKTIKWAGSPEKLVKDEQGRLSISPRESFQTWVEIFRGKSNPWTQLEIDAAHALSLSVIEVLTQHALTESEENYRFIAENSNDMVARFGEDYLYTFVSLACVNLFGYASHQMVGKSVLDFVVPEDRESFMHAVQDLQNENSSDKVLFRPLHGKGKETWIEYTLKRIVNAKEDRIEIIANGRDVTQRHTYQLAIEDLHRRNTRILEAAGDGLISVDQKGMISYLNDRVGHLLGFTSDQLIGQACCSLFHQSECGHPLNGYPAACPLINSESHHSGGLAHGVFKHKQGQAVSVEYTCTPMSGDDQVNGAVIVFRVKNEQEKDLSQTSRAIINEAAEAVLVTDEKRKIVSVNRAFTSITGYSAEEAIGQTPTLLRSGVHTQNFYESMYTALSEHHYWSGEIWNRRKNGEIFPQWGSITPIFDEQGKIKNYINVFTDISKAKQADERLYYLANHDPLTGLANRTKFVDFLNYTLDRARRARTEKVAVAFIDLDRFKIINDTLGHAIGDLYLKALAARISSACRSHDLLSRWGGDEFVLAMDHVLNQDSALEVVRRIMELVQQPLIIEGHELVPTLSVGISIFPDDADNTTDLVKAADTAMYRVKESGRNGYAFFTEHQADVTKQRFEIVSEINRALRLNEFVLHFQPQVKPDTGEIVGLESLIRWNHPVRGQLSPAAFIPLAEELGLINQIGKWVIQAACIQMALWKKEGVPFPRVAVNVAPAQFNDELVEFIQRTLAEHGLAASHLELELTEGALAQESQVGPIMRQLRELGISLSIDDFGTGYSSIGHLKNFPITCFKIDKSFIDHLPDNEQDAAIVKTILSLGENFKVEVVVEGVESKLQRDYLASVGAKIIQGYFYDKPLNVVDITRCLKLGSYEQR